MNVGSILNGDLPPDNDPAQKGKSDTRPPAQPFHHKHSINNLLNDPPANAASADDQLLSLPEVSRTSITSLANLTTEIEADLSSESTKKEAKGESSPKQTKETKPKKQAKQNARPKQSIVNGELERLNKLKGPKKKPQRYSEPPIWAREWIPPSQQHRENGYAEHAQPQADASISLKAVFDRASTYSADLECLITGVIPPQSTVRAVAEWIYANFVKILLENRQYMELELKFGTLIDKDSGIRLDVGVSSECIYTRLSNIRFDMGVHEVGWNEMKSYLEELEKVYQEENRKNPNPNKPRRKFNTTESDATDFFYLLTERNEMPKRIRVSKDNTLSPPRYIAIQKQRLSDLYIHNPSSMYDLRLSMSLEMPVEEGSIEPIMKKNKPALQRMKKRSSWSHAPTVTRFDFTAVLVPKTTKNKAGKTVTESDRSHELELEIDTYQIFRGFDKVRDGSDSIRFEELVEVFLNNARCLNNRVTKLASAA